MYLLFSICALVEELVTGLDEEFQNVWLWLYARKQAIVMMLRAHLLLFFYIYFDV